MPESPNADMCIPKEVFPAEQYLDRRLNRQAVLLFPPRRSTPGRTVEVRRIVAGTRDNPVQGLNDPSFGKLSDPGQIDGNDIISRVFRLRIGHDFRM